MVLLALLLIMYIQYAQAAPIIIALQHAKETEAQMRILDCYTAYQNHKQASEYDSADETLEQGMGGKAPHKEPMHNAEKGESVASISNTNNTTRDLRLSRRRFTTHRRSPNRNHNKRKPRPEITHKVE